MWSSASELIPIVALGTPGRLEQVLDNLLANALDVAPAGSTILCPLGQRVPRAPSCA